MNDFWSTEELGAIRGALEELQVQGGRVGARVRGQGGGGRGQGGRSREHRRVGD